MIRITKEHAFDTAQGLHYAKQLLEKAHKLFGKRILFGDAHPCTGGCAFQAIAVAKAKRSGDHRSLKRLEKLHAVQRQLLCNTDDLLGFAWNLNQGVIPSVAHEWPKSCTYWRLDSVIRFVSKYNLAAYRVDGCMVGVVSLDSGMPIRKPWVIKTNIYTLGSAIQVCCDGSHKHVLCQGKETKRSERYTPALARRIHSGWEEHCSNLP